VPVAFQLSCSLPPCVLFEDEHLLVVNKPPGWNTHAPSPYAGEGIYDWLKHREPRWANLAIIHRLDKETSGVMVFGKTTVANRSLTEQFAGRAVRKNYLLITDRAPKRNEFTTKSNIVRAGERYASSARGEPAETRFQIQNRPATACIGGCELMAEPLTGRTHQIRVHAAENGFPILGDTLYGGAPFARVCLHAVELSFKHPGTGAEIAFRAPVDFSMGGRKALREAILDLEETNSFRVIHGAGDGLPGWYLDWLGEFLLMQSEHALTPDQANAFRTLITHHASHITPVYHRMLSRHTRGSTANEASPRLVIGGAAPDRFVIRENGVKFELSFNEGCSVGLFLDQRDNRRRLLMGHVGAELALSEIRNPKSEMLNCFAYTCGFSVCAARAGARTTSLDLSKKYLEWGKRNFTLNGLNPSGHDFIYGDVFDWLRRLQKKRRVFDFVVLDPPTFSRSKEHGTFRAEKDFGHLVKLALPVLKSNGVLFASTNAATLKPETFLAIVAAAIRSAGRKISRQHYVPQPPDFPVTRAEPAYLKTVWLQIA